MSEAYLQAVVLRAGFNLSYFKNDRGKDGTIEAPNRRGINKIDYQLKSTTRYSIRNSVVVYALDVNAYNYLVQDDGFPSVLILFIMPDDEDQWLVQSDDELCIRKCAYWVSLMGEPRSSNRSTKTVEVPVANIFSPSGLDDMFDQLVS